MLLKELFIWAFRGQNVGPGWVKNGKKGCFRTSHLLPTQFSLKTKFLAAIVYLDTKQTKG